MICKIDWNLYRKVKWYDYINPFKRIEVKMEENTLRIYALVRR